MCGWVGGWVGAYIRTYLVGRTAQERDAKTRETTNELLRDEGGRFSYRSLATRQRFS